MLKKYSVFISKKKVKLFYNERKSYIYLTHNN